ncbi:transcription initiation factor TFIID subunit 4 isoform X1 [Oryzias melastigma]|uniref:TATA-box binding protein associated factor 4 n=1 Tax=Oryzias melastigma TaxID=30732 RepID=A0A3B3BLM0_ORYME|nr:transcription initiation factor TFIID subunit 4 isoform X1 [Oryzias melastigma]
MRLTNERGLAKMAASSDLLGDVFFKTEGDEKVRSELIGSLDTESTQESHVNSTGRAQSETNHADSSAIRSSFNIQGSKMGLSQQELAKAGAGVQRGVSSSSGCLVPRMDGAAGITPAVEAVVNPAQSQAQPATASGVVAGAPDAASGLEKPAGAQSLNGSAAVTNCHIAESRADSSQPNGPAPACKEEAAVMQPSTIIRTTLGAPNVPSPGVVPAQPGARTVPTVTLVKPLVQTSSNSPVLASSSPVISVSSGSPATKTDCPKSVILTGAPAAPGATATIRSPGVWPNPRTAAPSTIAAAPGGVRTPAPQVLAPRLSQPQQNTTNIQNIQLPPGMVLIRSESGQLLMIHQQTLAQMQAQSQSQSAMTPRPAAPTSTPPVQTSLQTPGAPLLTRPVTSTTIIKQASPVQTTGIATTALQRPPVLQNTVMLGVTASGQPIGTPAKVQPAGAAPQRVGPGTAVAPTPVSAETLENVKKCRNFLSTLIKLASGKQSPQTSANVKELIKNLLQAKIEPEDFTSRLYKELSSSPQPYLVPFLKRSLPALRQMTPDPDAFIQQSLLPLPSTQPAATASTALTAVVLRPPLSTTVTTATSTAKATVISLTQTPQSKPGLIVSQQQGTMVRPQVPLAQSPVVTIRGQPHSRIIVGQPQVVKQLTTVPAVRQTLAPGVRGVQVFGHASVADAQKNKLKEAGGGAFKDDDDINDVASMAGVNLSEESARILATSSELVGMVTRSCKDEAFLSTPSLSRIALEIGKKFGVSELGTDVISYISHATQQRLQNLLEKVSQVAHHKNVGLKEDERCEQVSDVRGQLKFFEQLDQLEKQKKEEQEREILLKAAKSRSRQEDPEQLRLKQKAKEMQQLELAQIRQREANLAALAAIGPRKKRKTDSPVRGASADGSSSGPSQPGGSGGSRQFTRQRITRVNLRDLLFCLENEKETSHSQLLYKGFLK